MKKVTFTIDDRSHSLLKSVAWGEDKTMSSLLRIIVTKRIREMAHNKGMLKKHEIEEFIKSKKGGF